MGHPEPISKGRCIFRSLAGFLFLVAADQLSKFLAVRYLKDAPDRILIPGVFQLSYLENRGMAWGMLGGMRWLIVIFTAVILAALVCLWRRVPFTGHYLAFRVLSVLFAAGAVGNVLDRLFRGFVVDFFYFSLIDFPVFNVADCLVCISLILIVILYRNEDFSWMSSRS